MLDKEIILFLTHIKWTYFILPMHYFRIARYHILVAWLTILGHFWKNVLCIVYLNHPKLKSLRIMDINGAFCNWSCDGSGDPRNQWNCIITCKSDHHHEALLLQNKYLMMVAKHLYIGCRWKLRLLTTWMIIVFVRREDYRDIWESDSKSTGVRWSFTSCRNEKFEHHISECKIYNLS